VQKYLTTWHYSYDPIFLGVSTQVWDGLDTDTQEQMRAAATEAMEYQRQITREGTAEGVAFLRDLIICDTDEEARHIWENSSRWAGEKWFVDFGFRQGMKDPDTGEMPGLEEVLANGYALVGSEDTVCRQLETMAGRLPLNWLFCWMFSGLVAHDVNMHSLERLATKVLPRLGLSLEG